MKEYYLVDIPNGDQKFTVICKRKHTLEDAVDLFYEWKASVFGEYVNNIYVVDMTFKDIITGKMIFPRRTGHVLENDGKVRTGCLTYVDKYELTDEKNVREITSEEALRILQGMSEEEIEDYKMTLNNLENAAILEARESRKAQREARRAERQNDRDISSLAGRFK